MRIKYAVCAAVLVATSGLLTGCGGNEDEATAAKNIKAEFLKEDVAGADLSEKQAGCIADEMVSEVGVEQLQDYGVLDKDLKVEDKIDDVKLKKDDAEAVAKSFTGCVDAKELVEKQFSQEETGMNDEQSKCIQDVLTEDKIEEMLALSFQGKEDEIQSTLQDDLVKCISG